MRRKVANLVGEAAVVVMWLCTYEVAYKLGMRWFGNFWVAVVPAFVVSLLILRLGGSRLFERQSSGKQPH